MSVVTKTSVLLFIFLLLFSCSSDKSGYVDVPESHGDEVKNNQSSTDLVLKSGNYGNLLLAIDSNKVSALLSQNGQSCYFIETEFTKFSAETPLKWRKIGTDLRGVGKFIAEKDAVWIHLSGNAPACAPELFKSPQKLSITKLNNWKKIRAVNKNAAEISSEPLDGMKTGQSFKKGDIICILEQKNEWLRVEKISQSAQVGWIKLADIE